MEFSNFFSQIVSFPILISHILIIPIIFYAFFIEKRDNHSFYLFLKKRGLLILFLISLVATLGSLIYSSVIGFDPCVLCIWQRIFLFPQVIILAIALKKKYSGIVDYLIPLTIIGGIIALYHVYISLGFNQLGIPCGANPGETSCLIQYVNEFGYITIPVMSLTVYAYILALQIFIKKQLNKA
ncbi:MAG: disulfide bond formation protein B [Candidatus Pacebacteria bacterium]|nr:disulfide bond formation protein B [Candidatus Paceibacterota bacterium]